MNTHKKILPVRIYGSRISYFYSMKKTLVSILCAYVFVTASEAQLGQQRERFTHADTLRGSLNPNRTWWDVLKYDIAVEPDYNSKTIEAKTIITFAITKAGEQTMQIDLQQPLIIDSVIIKGRKVDFKKIDTNVWYVYLENLSSLEKQMGSAAGITATL